MNLDMFLKVDCPACHTTIKAPFGKEYADRALALAEENKADFVLMGREKPMIKFWECYVENTGGGQHYKHYSLEEAEEEAERLARKEGKTVYLFQCLGKCRAEEVPVRWEVPR